MYTWKVDSYFEKKLLIWADKFSYVTFLNPNGWQNSYPQGAFPKMLAVANEALQQSFLAENLPQHSWLFGYLGYDLKNQIEQLESNNPNPQEQPESVCFQPLHLFIWQDENNILIESPLPSEKLWQDIHSNEAYLMKNQKIKISERTDFELYKKNVESIKTYIKEGDVYELNYCIEFYAENISIEPIFTYLALNERTKMPFSSFLKAQEHYVLCASPERFLKKSGKKVVSQPIKGTIRRGKTFEEDENLKYILKNSPKEIAENMMIVDLVRNDLARSAEIGSVQVSELFGIYSFEKLHQMISTVEATISSDTSPQKVIHHAFPMGSMTGAPKIRAMQLIEQHENSKRGIYSGAIGFFSPTGDFDFNVVIRSIFYNAYKNYLSFWVGSAITYDADASQEYQECLLKASAIRDILENPQNIFL
ncbi:MAG: anthranilate synthase component I family protein [Thermonemataceae bacterium]|nr:anthranilate synthase component I family protein [Thermonemataceae bacterium]